MIDKVKDKLPRLATFLVEQDGRYQKFSITRLCFGAFFMALTYVWTKVSSDKGVLQPIDFSVTAFLLALPAAQVIPKLKASKETKETVTSTPDTLVAEKTTTDLPA